MEVTDFYGQIIAPGAKVAYNWGGQVRIGVVDRVTGSRGNPTIYVRSSHQENLSRVASRFNMVVIPPGDS